MPSAGSSSSPPAATIEDEADCAQVAPGRTVRFPALAARLGRAVRWDPEHERVIGDDEAQAMTDKEYRKPWTHEMRFAAS